MDDYASKIEGLNSNREYEFSKMCDEIDRDISRIKDTLLYRDSDSYDTDLMADIFKMKRDTTNAIRDARSLHKNEYELLLLMKIAESKGFCNAVYTIYHDRVKLDKVEKEVLELANKVPITLRLIQYIKSYSCAYSNYDDNSPSTAKIVEFAGFNYDEIDRSEFIKEYLSPLQNIGIVQWHSYYDCWYLTDLGELLYNKIANKETE